MSVAAVPDGRLSTLPARPLPFRGASKRVGRQLHFEARSAEGSVPVPLPSRFWKRHQGH
jgi:hypothetical protein